MKKCIYEVIKRTDQGCYYSENEYCDKYKMFLSGSTCGGCPEFKKIPKERKDKQMPRTKESLIRENKKLKNLINDLMFWIDEDGLPKLYGRMREATKQPERTRRDDKRRRPCKCIF